MGDEGTSTTILAQDALVPREEQSTSHVTALSEQDSSNRRAANRGFIRALRGGGGGGNRGAENTEDGQRGGGGPNRNITSTTDNISELPSPSKIAPGDGVGGKTLNARRGRRCSAEHNTNRSTMRQGLSASLHGRVAGGLRGIGGIVNRGQRGSGGAIPTTGRPGAAIATAEDGDDDNNPQQDVDSGTGAASTTLRRGRKGPKAFIMSKSMSGLPSRNQNRRIREMMLQQEDGEGNTPNNNLESGVLIGTTTSKILPLAVEEHSVASDASGAGGDGCERVGSPGPVNRRRSAESRRSSLSSLLSEDHMTECAHPDLEGVEKVRQSSFIRSQQRESFKERRGSLKQRRTSVSSIPETEGIENFPKDDDDIDDLDDAGLANIVQSMYGGGSESVNNNNNEGKVCSRRSSNASQSSTELLQGLNEARAQRRASIEHLRVRRRASLSGASCSSENSPSHPSSTLNEKVESSTRTRSYGSSSGNDANGQDNAVVERVGEEKKELPAVENKESLMDNLRHLAETIHDDTRLNDESDYDSEDDELQTSKKRHPNRSTPSRYEGIQGSNVTTTNIIDDNVKDEDSFLGDIDQQTMAQTCAMEHRIFLKAALDLLTERERLAVEASLQREGDESGILKCGVLKKSSQLMKGIWKVKYAEIKKGVFVYYDDDSTSSSASSALIVSSPSTGSSKQLNCSSGSQKSLLPSPVRKFIPLISGEVKVRPVKLKNLAKAHNKNGYFFELSMIPDGPKRLWMTSTREERQSWMKAIDDAIVGGSPATKSDVFSNYICNNRRNSKNNRTIIMSSGVDEDSPYRHCLDKYLAVEQQLKSAHTKQAYMGGLSILLRDPLRIPVQWIRMKMGGTSSTSNSNSDATESGGGQQTQQYHAFHEEGTNQSIQQLWKDLVRDSVSINDVIIRGGDGHGPERILGALTKCILDYDEERLKLLLSGGTSAQSSPSSHHHHSSSKVRRKYQMNESQGISYACDILLACNRTRSAGDSYYSMDMLCRNPGLVVLCPVSSEALPLKIIVKPSNDDASSSSEKNKVHAGGPQRSWVSLRGSDKKNNQWQQLFCILSEGVMSYYEKELPTPQKLRGQLILVGAKMGACELVGDRAFAESDRTRKRLMKCIGESKTPCNEFDGTELFQGRGTSKGSKGSWYIIGVVSKTGAKDVQLCFQTKTDFMKWKDAIRSAIEASSGDSSSSILSTSKTKTKHVSHQALNNTKEQENNKGADLSDDLEDDDDEQEKIDSNGSSTSRPTLGQPTVQVTVEASTAYRICTIDPQGDEDEDTWATIQTKFVQSFRLSGGSSGMITRGEEIVQMLLLRGSASNEAFERVLKMKNKSKIGALEGLSMQKFAYRNMNT